ncbi:hypothetical protein QM467_06160 [Rhodoblastus sp. 17X3]|uniref:hypothetical protein n=1 Tax=Rhodoblastus sp. 17X3 TaxID=3047026 RepID=UPI0024B7AD79|nr:hypothetical protein [Rhodoblastus sp. 17X3]MDI9847644.1 hypothetical protein [Rhodoblastus sp. 17X3]
MYASEKKIDRLLNLAGRNSDILFDVSANLARINQKLDEIAERLRVADLRQWSASRAALGLWSPVWEDEFARQFNFDQFEGHLADQSLPPKSVRRGATPVGNNPAQIAATWSSYLAHPFAITCGEGWNPLICRSLEKMFALASMHGFKLGIAQVIEINGRLKIQVESIGLRAHVAAQLQRVADLAEACSTGICEMCGEEGALRQIRDSQKVRCLAHTIHGDE